MSRIGRKIITIPEKVTVTKEGNELKVQGPLGTLIREFKSDIEITITDGTISFKPVKETVANSALWGTYASHVENMVIGVSTGFTKKMLIEGVGFKWNVNGTTLTLNVGFSHEVILTVPDGLKVVVEKSILTVTGFDKELVGQFCAKVRDYKRVEPYKGKGIRYDNEHVRRKQGKKTAA